MRKKGRHALLEMLIAHGVEYVFGNPGTTELPLMDGLQDSPQFEVYPSSSGGLGSCHG